MLYLTTHSQKWFINHNAWVNINYGTGILKDNIFGFVGDDIWYQTSVIIYIDWGYRLDWFGIICAWYISDFWFSRFHTLNFNYLNFFAISFSDRSSRHLAGSFSFSESLFLPERLILNLAHCLIGFSDQVWVVNQSINHMLIDDDDKDFPWLNMTACTPYPFSLSICPSCFFFSWLTDWLTCQRYARIYISPAKPRTDTVFVLFLHHPPTRVVPQKAYTIVEEYPKVCIHEYMHSPPSLASFNIGVWWFQTKSAEQSSVLPHLIPSFG